MDQPQKKPLQCCYYTFKPLFSSNHIPLDTLVNVSDHSI